MQLHEEVKRVNDDFFKLCNNERCFSNYIRTVYPHDPLNPEEVKLSLLRSENDLKEFKKIRKIIKSYKELNLEIKYGRIDSYDGNNYKISYDKNGLIVKHPSLNTWNIFKILDNTLKIIINGSEYHFNIKYEETLNEFVKYQNQLKEQISKLEESVNSNIFENVKPNNFDDKFNKTFVYERIKNKQPIQVVEMPYREYYNYNTEQVEQNLYKYSEIIKYLKQAKLSNVKITFSIGEKSQLEIHKDKIHIVFHPKTLDTIYPYETYLALINHEIKKLNDRKFLLKHKEYGVKL